MRRGVTMHGDLFSAWKDQAWHEGCIRARRDCHAHLLGDGRAIY
jgi:hypothetical protein